MSAPKGMTAVQSGEHRGIEWCIVAAPLPGGNGYVRVPDENRWHGSDYDDIDVDVHGGLTFSGGDWIGFDTLHGGDYWPEDEIAKLGRSWRTDYRLETAQTAWRTWSVEALVAETKRLAEQIASASWM